MMTGSVTTGRKERFHARVQWGEERKGWGEEKKLIEKFSATSPKKSFASSFLLRLCMNHLA
jgi:hypothetical protein